MSQVVYLTVDQQQHHHPNQKATNPPRVVDFKSQTHPDQVHPHLLETTDPLKGRQFRASHLITKGTILLIDPPYAILPVVDNPAANDTLICSNPSCNRPSPCNSSGRCSCPNACVPDVAWCSTSCQDADQFRHVFECTWLKRYARSIRSKWGEYTFGMLWVIVRLLATRHCEISSHHRHHRRRQQQEQDQQDQQPKRWAGIDSLCGSTHTWPHAQVRTWTILVKKYLQNSPTLPHGLTPERILHLICQEEANSFGLYPRETGLLPIPDPPLDRGEQFGAAVYPTAAIANHSCSPNVCPSLPSITIIQDQVGNWIPC